MNIVNHGYEKGQNLTDVWNDSIYGKFHIYKIYI